jgi:hypothetical protein
MSNRSDGYVEKYSQQRGGQTDHRGLSHKLKAVVQVDRVIDLRPIGCNRCGHLLLGDDADAARHQVSEVPITGCQQGDGRYVGGI